MHAFQCPACNTMLMVSQGSPTIGWSEAPRFEMAMGGVAGEASTWTRQTPTRTPTPAGDVLVPLAQAAITGGVATILAGTLSAVQGWPWWITVGAGAVALAASWLVLLADHRSLLRVIETVASGDPAPAAEPAQALRLEVTEHHDRNSDTVRFLDLPCDDATLAHIARGVLAGHPFSEREWAGKNRPISGPKFRRLQDTLLEAGYLRWASTSDRRQGVALTRKGEQLFREVSGGL